jgi:hypothetical protein
VAEGPSLDDFEVLIRRCDPTKHLKKNEETGEPVFSRAGFRWDDGQTSLSVYRDAELERLRAPRRDVLEDATWQLWAVSAAEARAIAVDDGSSAFDAVADPITSDDPEKPTPPRDAAHALIVKPAKLAQRFVRSLAQSFHPLPLDRPLTSPPPGAASPPAPSA